MCRWAAGAPTPGRRSHIAGQEHYVASSLAQPVQNIRVAGTGRAGVGLFAALLASAVTSSSAQAASPPGASAGQSLVAPYTGFGGYQLDGSVNQIGAEWRVPKATSSANASYGAFIQVGTLAYVNKGHQTRYEAFWTDNSPEEDLHTRNLGPPKAGDLVSASMTETPNGWNLMVINVTQAKRSNRSVAYGGGEPLQRGEWVVEDPLHRRGRRRIYRSRASRRSISLI